MKKVKNNLFTCLSFISMLAFSNVYAQTDNPVEEKYVQQNQVDSNPYAINLYEPTYILPFSYTSSFNSAAESAAPENETLDKVEARFNFSVRASVWKNFFNYKNSLNLAYTQLSFWQVYQKSPFFRESNYQPEIFFENVLDKPLVAGWRLHFLNVGVIHDSNGLGGFYERSWNRIYGETIFSRPNWFLSIRPWYVIRNSSLKNNTDITSYLGYERVVLSYQFHNQDLSLLTYNLEHVGTRPSVQLTWSFPLVSHFRGYVQGFNGYGQSLIEYNHHNESISVGIALNDWI